MKNFIKKIIKLAYFIYFTCKQNLHWRENRSKLIKLLKKIGLYLIAKKIYRTLRLNSNISPTESIAKPLVARNLMAQVQNELNNHHHQSIIYLKE